MLTQTSYRQIAQRDQTTPQNPPIAPKNVRLNCRKNSCL